MRLLFMENSNVKKYHVSLGFRPCDIGEAKSLIEALKYRRVSFSVHALKELGAELEAVKIGQFIKDYSLDFNDVFEIALIAGRIEKLGFRVKMGDFDVILIINREKNIITLWTNENKDKHISLNPRKYCTV
jgi:hypothetical protein